MAGDDARESGDWAAVADVVKSRAAELQLTQQTLASRAGVSLATVQELWKGLPRNRQPRTLHAVAKALERPTEYLLEVLNGKPPVEPEARLGGVEVQDELRAIREDLAKLMRRLDALGDRLEEGP